MYHIKKFEAYVDKTAVVSDFTALVKQYCEVSGKEFMAVMNLITHSNHDFSVIKFEHESYKAELTIDNKLSGTLLITEKAILWYE